MIHFRLDLLFKYRYTGHESQFVYPLGIFKAKWDLTKVFKPLSLIVHSLSEMKGEISASGDYKLQ